MKNKGIFKKGFDSRRSNPFVIGHDPRRKPKTGKDHYAWQEESPSYLAVHKWLLRTYGHPKSCTNCYKLGGFVGKKRKTWNIQWANTKNTYIRNVAQFIGLCAKCHRRYDIENGLIKTSWKPFGYKK